jgi:S-adenosylmethionine:tRNA ribosyltransferase-isomerase
LKTLDFEYHLPQKFIAQKPLEPRDASRLMVLEKTTGKVRDHSIFRDLGNYLKPGDLLVLNQTRVIPARLIAWKIPTGGKIEILLLKQNDTQTWECLVGGKGLVVGRRVKLESGTMAQIIDDLGGARRLINFSDRLERIMPEIGQMPLPPYIYEKLQDPERYQTIYAKESGSSAAPTAGLHFTNDLLTRLRDQGVGIAAVTLHVGLDTFAPVKEDDPGEHEIHTEWYQVTPDVIDMIRKTIQNHGRIIAVGTTSVRTLETIAPLILNLSGSQMPLSGSTDLFILPGYQFKVVDALITNFHLPRSTLIMLVSAFVGRENILSAYEIAKQENYRFYSFGDAMLIL